MGKCPVASAEASNDHCGMSRMAEAGQEEEEAYRVVEEVEGNCGTRAVGGHNADDRTT